MLGNLFWYTFDYRSLNFCIMKSCNVLGPFKITLPYLFVEYLVKGNWSKTWFYSSSCNSLNHLPFWTIKFCFNTWYSNIFFCNSCYFELFSTISCSSYAFGLFSGPLSRSNITETNLNSRKCICIKISVCPAFDTLPIRAFGGIWHNFLTPMLDSFERYNISGVISETLYIISSSQWQIHRYKKMNTDSFQQQSSTNTKEYTQIQENKYR